MGKASAIYAAFLLVVGIFAVRAAAMAPAPKREPAPSPPPAQAPVRIEQAAPGQYRFTHEEMGMIRDFFRTAPPSGYAEPAPGKKMKTLPPGLQKKVERGGELPPGWQKKIARGEVIDARVYEHSRPLPPELVKRLPPYPRGTVVVTIEGKVVRLMEATLTILDVFDLL